VIVDLWPPTMMLPLRSVLPFGATVKFTLPFPLPATGGASEIQLTLVVAVHPHSLIAATVTRP
jgi:hypothetical protein